MSDAQLDVVQYVPTRETSVWRRRRYRGIQAFTGLPGSGKTYELTAWLLRQIAAGRPTYTSAGYDIPGARQFHDLHEFVRIPDGAAIGIDEAPVWLDARMWQSLPPWFTYRITQTRHHGIDIRYTAIDPSMVEKRLRSITFEFWEFRALAGPFNLYRYMKSPEGAPKLRKDDGRWHVRRMRQETADSYDSHANADVSKLELNDRPKGRAA